MGYYANGNGLISFNENTKSEVLGSALDILEEQFTVEPCLEEDGAKELLLSFGYDPYHQEEIITALNKVSALTGFEKGWVEFDGEDGSHWRFICKHGRWVEENGHVSYDDETFYVRMTGVLIQIIDTALQTSPRASVKELLEQFGVTADDAEMLGLDLFRA